MVTLLAGGLLLLIGLYGMTIWTKTDPKVLIRTALRTLAVVSLVGAAGALVMGRVSMAMGLGMLGFALLGRNGGGRGLGGMFRGLGGSLGGLGGLGSTPKTSQVQTSLLEMELDHGSGDMRGRILSGVYAGRALEELTVPDIMALRAECDAQSLALLEAYLDRRAPAWREHAQGDAGGGGGTGRAPTGNSAMTEEEAYEILGLEPGAEPARVREAHRALMKKVHPDHGGSDYLAARINQAKDAILRKHG